MNRKLPTAKNSHHGQLITSNDRDLKGYGVTKRYSFEQFEKVSIEALDEILLNLMNGADDIEASEVLSLVGKCQQYRLALNESNMLPAVSSMLVQREIEDISVKNTRDQLSANIKVWMAWCNNNGYLSFPAAPASIATFLESLHDTVKTNTVKSYIWALRKLHESGGIPDPTKTRKVKKALEAYLEYRSQVWRDSPKQAVPMRREQVVAIYQHYKPLYKSNPLLCRDFLVLLMAYDTLLREAELTRIRIEDIIVEDGIDVVTVHLTKTNRGITEYRPITDLTSKVLKCYLEQTKRNRTYIGPLFLRHYVNGRVSLGSACRVRELNKSNKVGRRKEKSSDAKVADFLTTSTIYSIFIKASSILIEKGFPEKLSLLSGHSARVGKAKDLRKGGVEMESIMEAGGWSGLSMVYHYTADQALTRKSVLKFNDKLMSDIKDV